MTTRPLDRCACGAQLPRPHRGGPRQTACLACRRHAAKDDTLRPGEDRILTGRANTARNRKAAAERSRRQLDWDAILRAQRAGG
jgi:hypothetical protein